MYFKHQMGIYLCIFLNEKWSQKNCISLLMLLIIYLMLHLEKQVVRMSDWHIKLHLFALPIQISQYKQLN